MKTRMKMPKAPHRTIPATAFYVVNRSLYDSIADRRFGRKEIDEVLTYFGKVPLECTFCGSSEVVRWDHLHPVTRGGDTVLGNMVPACQLCDDSKGDRSFSEWMTGASPGSPKTRGVANIGARIERIHAYVAHYGYQPRSFEQRLSSEELKRLQDIQQRLKLLRQDVDSLVFDVRKRNRTR